ncbi:uncharacterized protein LOC119556459 [Drosophila subpulchrella]|uniref:uncharacterized protein LOC119556459 n=1 Tax=Drosophila subpulchrella TaxID=1486046 RepID=UPI0018A16DDC|nr:uncharacterized protein LOC119556459 [Drosophila subpulchrella]
MPVLRLSSFFTKFFPSKRVRVDEVERRRQLAKCQEQRKNPMMSKTPRVDFSADPIVLPMPRNVAKGKLRGKHVIGSFQLKVEHDPLAKRLEITATLPSPRLPPETAPAPQDEQLYELFVCSSQGKLLARIPFLESDYRRAAHQAIDSMSD